MGLSYRDSTLVGQNRQKKMEDSNDLIYYRSLKFGTISLSSLEEFSIDQSIVNSVKNRLNYNLEPWMSFPNDTPYSYEDYILLDEDESDDDFTSNDSSEDEEYLLQSENKEVVKEIPSVPKNPWAKGAPSFSQMISKSILNINNTENQTENDSNEKDTQVDESNVETLINPSVSIRSVSGFDIEDIRPVQPRGLINNGNMCFMNAILQPLVHLVPFFKLFQFLKKKIPYSFNSKTPLTDAIILLISEFNQENIDSITNNRLTLNKGKPFAPEYVYEALRRLRNINSHHKGRQEDAEEFFGFLLDGLDSEFSEQFQKSELIEYKQLLLDMDELIKELQNETVMKALFISTKEIESVNESISHDKPFIPWRKDVDISDFTTLADEDRDLATALLLSKETLDTEIQNKKDKNNNTENSECGLDSSSEAEMDDEDLNDENILLARMALTLDVDISNVNKKEASLNKKVPQKMDLRSIFESRASTPDQGYSSAGTGDDEWKSIGRKSKVIHNRVVTINTSPITSLFCGALQTTVKRSKSSNKSDSINTEPFQTLQLDISSDSIQSLEEAFAQFFEPELIQISDASERNDINENDRNLVIARNELAKQSLLHKLPPVLIIHFKRFVYDVHAAQTVKLSKFIRFKDELIIEQEWMSETLRDTLLDKTRPATYKLQSVIHHHGNEAGGGHYTCQVRRAGTNTPPWLLFDDDIVVSLEQNEVLYSSKDKQAYMLLYVRT